MILLAPPIKIILNLKIDICYLKNICLDPVYCKEYCDIYSLLQQRIYVKIFKNYCGNIGESFFFIFEKYTEYRERYFKALGFAIH